MATHVREGLARLDEYADTGKLASLCRRHGIELMVVFGSAARDEPHPADLDLAVRFSRDAKRDILQLLDDVYELTGVEAVDLMVFNDAGPVAREHATVEGRPLYQARSGAFATEQISAIMERMDTDHLRRLDLELLAQ
ncbi:MAG: nucleotidyltransferase domain-containing protein [Actinomycetota bacterium]|nr:nucleotidyltransferase domain-containing protein [Actinomycetota bacterium]